MIFMRRLQIPIGVVERETCISKETLRKWEERYGFPSPARTESGVRVYSASDLYRLRTIKRLIDAGMRPGEAIALDAAESKTFLSTVGAAKSAVTETVLEAEVVQSLRGADPYGCLRILDRERRQRSVPEFVVEVIKPLVRSIGTAWADGRLTIRHEHLFSENVQEVLRACMQTLPDVQGDRKMILATPPGESHTLGLLMMQSMLRAHNVQGMSLGAQLPAAEIAEAAERYDADIVGISVSAAYPQRATKPFLQELRFLLPDSIALWTGGDGSARLASVPKGIKRFTSLAMAIQAIGTLPSGSSV